MRRLIVLALAAAAAGGCGSHVAENAAPASRALKIAKPDRRGHWTKLLLSTDGRTYLGQWSGECEIQTAYFVDADGGKPRPITNYERGSAESVALGWVGSKARVRLPQGRPPERKPGIYLVDPETMAMTLERPLPMRPGC
jgi:hypothetical protein